MANSRLLIPQPLHPDARIQEKLAALDVRLRAVESLFSPVRITTIISAIGPLPLSANLATYGGKLLLIASGSGYTSSAPAAGEGFNVEINGTAVVSSIIGINVNGVHAAVPTVAWGPTVPTGTLPLTIGLTATTNFLTDGADRFTVLAIELL